MPPLFWQEAELRWKCELQEHLQYIYKYGWNFACSPVLTSCCATWFLTGSEQALGTPVLEPPEGAWLCWHFGVRFLASRTIKNIAVILSHLVCVNLLWQPWETKCSLQHFKSPFLCFGDIPYMILSHLGCLFVHTQFLESGIILNFIFLKFSFHSDA